MLLCCILSTRGGKAEKMQGASVNSVYAADDKSTEGAYGLRANNKLCNKTRNPIHSSNKVIIQWQQ